MKFKYLVTEITSSGAIQSEAQHQAHKAARISGCLNDTMWRDKYLSFKLKKELSNQL
jgi:siderophore synthetase component